MGGIHPNMHIFIQYIYIDKKEMSRCNCKDRDRCNCKNKCKCKERCYTKFNYPDAVDNEKTLLTGVRHVKGAKDDEVYISGFYVPLNTANTTGFVYKGCLNGRGRFYKLNYPTINGTKTITNLYGPNNGPDRDTIRVVGNFTYAGLTGAFGCLYEGKLDGTGTWTTIVPPFGTVINTICHSTMGDLVVGNYDTLLVQGKAFIYNIITNQYTDITFDDVISVTAYGIWHNRGDHYTICGGLTTNAQVNAGYVVDFDLRRSEFRNLRKYFYDNDSTNAKITHFDGITIGKNDDTYNLTGMWNDDSTLVAKAFFAKVQRKCDRNRRDNRNNDRNDREFKKKAKWCPISFPRKAITTGNTVYKDTVIGVYKNNVNDETVNGYVAKVIKDCCDRRH